MAEPQELALFSAHDNTDIGLLAQAAQGAELLVIASESTGAAIAEQTGGLVVPVGFDHLSLPDEAGEPESPEQLVDVVLGKRADFAVRAVFVNFEPAGQILKRKREAEEANGADVPVEIELEVDRLGVALVEAAIRKELVTAPNASFHKPTAEQLPALLADGERMRWKDLLIMSQAAVRHYRETVEKVMSVPPGWFRVGF
jgi:hypothetical protein